MNARFHGKRPPNGATGRQDVRDRANGSKGRMEGPDHFAKKGGHYAHDEGGGSWGKKKLTSPREEKCHEGGGEEGGGSRSICGI